jgi:hypothetical protein
MQLEEKKGLVAGGEKAKGDETLDNHVEKKSTSEFLKHFFHHTADNGDELYCANTGQNWVYICGGLFAIWITIGLAVFLLLSAILEYGTPVLWMYFIVFWFFVAFVCAQIIAGEVQRVKDVAAEKERREREDGLVAAAAE